VALRLALASLALVALFTTGSKAAATPDSTERVRAVDRLVRAAAVDDEPAMWAALSRVSRRRLGPTLADFRRHGARGVRDEIAPFAQGSYRVMLDANVDRGLGVVAIAGGREHGALAVPVRRERGVWKAEIDPAVTVEAVRPVPGERVLRRTQVFAEVSAPGKIDGAAMWFDGRLFDARGYWSPNKKRMSLWGEAPQPLANGRHTVVAFATAGPEAAANAWVFTARGRGSGSR
jgi:hypothetical protein